MKLKKQNHNEIWSSIAESDKTLESGVVFSG
jgi:hypothetical protein